MRERLQLITEGINDVDNVDLIGDLEIDAAGEIKGQILITEQGQSLQFSLNIFSPYPMQFHDVETIRFVNKELIEFNHVNIDGSICIHTPHHEDIKSKIFYDVSSLKQWMVKYYINKEVDDHYDHIIIAGSTIDSYQSCYLFTDVDNEFVKGDFGNVQYSLMSKGIHNNIPIFTFLVQRFLLTKQTTISCKWSKHYVESKCEVGFFVFLEEPPVENKRFIVNSWVDLEPYVSQEFLKFLYEIQRKNNFSKNDIRAVPLFVGYKIPTGEIHWQCALIDIKAFPGYAEKVDGKYIGYLSEQPIKWTLTKNCSYPYFFGRGSLCEEITQKKILLIGIGAVGSMVATALTRGGCRLIHLVDHDIKEPENVCRSEYDFSSGLNSKVIDLKDKLIKISPFIEVSMHAGLMDAVKLYINTGKFNEEIKKEIEKYDLIIDCTADNDVAYILDSLNLKTTIINLSITNHAKELVCVVRPNLYQSLQQIFQSLNKNDIDLYNPTGCWSPTFKASYTDISVMVQYALKHINRTLKSHGSLRSFYVKCSDDDNVTITLHQF